MSPRSMRFCRAWGVRSARTISSTRCITQSGTVSRTCTPVICCTVGPTLSTCCTFIVESVGPGLQQFHDVFVPLRVLAALDVGMRQLVDHNYRWLAGENSVNIHLVKNRSLILDFARRNAIEFGGKFCGGLATMTLDHSHQHVFPTAGATNRLAQHAVGLTYSGSVAEKHFKNSARFFLRNFAQPLVGCLRHRTYCLSRRLNC